MKLKIKTIILLRVPAQPNTCMQMFDQHPSRLINFEIQLAYMVHGFPSHKVVDN